jgi:prevent-host-death family protein
MIKLNIHEAKTHLSRYLELVEKGESITLCKRNVPIAEIRPLQKAKTGKRPIGLGKGDFTVTDKFFEPLAKDLLDLFNGGGK